MVERKGTAHQYASFIRTGIVKRFMASVFAAMRCSSDCCSTRSPSVNIFINWLQKVSAAHLRGFHARLKTTAFYATTVIMRRAALPLTVVTKRRIRPSFSAWHQITRFYRRTVKACRRNQISAGEAIRSSSMPHRHLLKIPARHNGNQPICHNTVLCGGLKRVCARPR